MQKTLITILGGLILIVGVILVPLPGPGLIVIALGLAVLGREYHWARRLQERVKARITAALHKANEQRRGSGDK